MIKIIFVLIGALNIMCWYRDRSKPGFNQMVSTTTAVDILAIIYLILDRLFYVYLSHDMFCILFTSVITMIVQTFFTLREEK